MAAVAVAAAVAAVAPRGYGAWENPTRVVFDPGALAALGREAAPLGTHALLVSDRALPELARRAQALLGAAGVRVSTWDGVEREPGRAAAAAAAAAAREAGADLVVGLGGGSALDVAKVAAAAARNPALLGEEAWAVPGLVTPALDRPRRGLPLVAVPTTAATGSEVNPLASLVDPGGGGRKKLLLHPLLQPRVAIVDPALALSLPARATAEGSVAAVARLLVPYLTETRPTPLQDLYAEATLRVVLELTPRALADGGDLDARSGLALAATSSMVGWTTIGRDPLGNPLWYLQNALSPLAAASKGAAVAALLPGYLRFVVARSGELPRLGDPARLVALGRALFGAADAAATVAALEDVLAAWSLPTRLGEVGVDEQLVPALARETVEMWGGVLPWLRREDAAALYYDAL